MLRKRLVLLASTVALALSPVVARAQDLVRVYVQAGTGDFVGNGVTDSALDLRKALLGKSRTLVVVNSAAEADVMARVDSRNERKELSSVDTYSNSSKDGRSTTTTTSPTKRTVNELHVSIVAGGSQFPMETESPLSWRFAASDMADNIDRWVKENRPRLLSRRASQPDQPRLPSPQSNATDPPSRARAGGEDASISVGMSETQVLNAMGVPDKKINFGQKSMWNYRGMQVVFEGGKVTDVKF